MKRLPELLKTHDYKSLQLQAELSHVVEAWPMKSQSTFLPLSSSYTIDSERFPVLTTSL